jgi:hypothetical protein
LCGGRGGSHPESAAVGRGYGRTWSRQDDAGKSSGPRARSIVLSLDAIKESLYAAGVHPENPYELRLAAEAELNRQLGHPVITAVVDIWVAPRRDTDRVATMFRAHGRDVVEVLCRVPADVAVERYSRRQRSGPHRRGRGDSGTAAVKR